MALQDAVLKKEHLETQTAVGCSPRKALLVIFGPWCRASSSQVHHHCENICLVNWRGLAKILLQPGIPLLGGIMLSSARAFGTLRLEDFEGDMPNNQVERVENREQHTAVNQEHAASTDQTKRCFGMKGEGLEAHARPLGIVAFSNEVDCPMEGYWPRGQWYIGTVLSSMRLWTQARPGSRSLAGEFRLGTGATALHRFVNAVFLEAPAAASWTRPFAIVHMQQQVSSPAIGQNQTLDFCLRKWAAHLIFAPLDYQIATMKTPERPFPSIAFVLSTPVRPSSKFPSTRSPLIDAPPVSHHHVDPMRTVDERDSVSYCSLDPSLNALETKQHPYRGIRFSLPTSMKQLFFTLKRKCEGTAVNS
ncbi:hypothetical protein FIBSPDRAFT_934151 [Athelia psychrophila]|uniref:Uncharacterized protein n=1 Tax=Athelia psychrophila TaxID=1759441 RepID=A0A166FZ14_9AGAM|nr:hypothetical protein FIBSPDRAFT_934151 [Fibularhizoctonia sp. CBS 109695]